MKRLAYMKILPQLTLLSIFIVTVGCAEKRFDAALSDAGKYWSNLDSPGAIDSAELIRLCSPFADEAGIRYLTEKVSSTNRAESETAILLLAPLLGIFSGAETESDKVKVAPLIALVKASPYRAKAMEYSKNGGNAAIRHYLSLALAEAERGAPRTPDVPVSGEEDWTVAGRTYRIHDTVITMENRRGPLYLITVDLSRGVMAEMTDLINEEPEVIPRKAIAKYALDNGYFTKAMTTRVEWAQTQMQDRIVVITGRKVKGNFQSRGFLNGWTIRELEGQGLTNETAEAMR